MHAHAHCYCQTSSLAADCAVAQYADSFGGGVLDGVEVSAGPVGLFLQGEVVREPVVEGEVSEDEPFGDLGAVVACQSVSQVMPNGQRRGGTG